MPIRQARIPEPLSPQLKSAFSRAISPERWKTYERAAGFRPDLAHQLYLWNAAVGQSFHFPLQTVEVCLRNVIHLALVDIYGADWANDDAFQSAIRPKQVDDITKAARRHWSIYKADPSTPQIVASLSLGFWVAMLRKDYNKMIWQTHTSHAFPYLEPQETIISVSQTGSRIQDLRNRIFHQEPLIGHNLTEDYSAIIRMIGWICPDMRAWTRSHTSVPRVIRSRPR